MIRTRIRSDQEQDIDFVSESELNEFFGKVVITGTLAEDQENQEATQDTVVLETFKEFFPGQGLIIVDDGLTVTTGTQTVTISGFKNEFVAASGSLQSQITVAGGVTSITASGTTISGALTFDSLSGITLIPDFATNTLTFSGSGVTKIITVSGIEGDITIEGAGEVQVLTEGSTIVISGTPHTPFPDAIVGGTGITVTSGVNTTTIDGHLRYTKEENDAIVAGQGVVVTSGLNTITIDTFDEDDVDSINAVTGTVTLVGGVNADVVTAGQVITVNTFDDDDVDSINAVTGTVTITGRDQVVVTTEGQNVVVSGIPDEADVDSLNTVTGTISLVGGVNANVVTAGQTITINTFDDNDVDSINTVTGTISILSGAGINVRTEDPNITIDSTRNALVSDAFAVVVSGYAPGVDRIVHDAIIGLNSVTVTSGSNGVTVDVTGATQAATIQGGFVANSEGLSTTTATTFQLKVNMTEDLSPVFTGTGGQPFRLQWYYEWGYSSASSEIETQITVDDVDQLGTIKWSPASTNADNFAASMGFVDMTLSSGTHSFDLDYRATAAGKTARIQRARLALAPLTLGVTSTAPPVFGT